MSFIAGDWFDRPLPPNVRIGEGSHVYSSYAFLHHASERPCAVRIGRASGIYAGSWLVPHTLESPLAETEAERVRARKGVPPRESGKRGQGLGDDLR